MLIEAINQPSHIGGMTQAKKPISKIETLRKMRSWSQEQLKDRSGLSQNIIWKLENDKMPLRVEHLGKLAKAFGVSAADLLPDDMLKGASQPVYVSENEGEPYITPEVSRETPQNPQDKAISALIGDDPNRSAWTLQSHALDGCGYKVGDILILDQSQQPVAGDIVCAQLLGTTDAETVFRIYQPPFLMPANPQDSNLLPTLIDNRRVHIVGVIAQSLRSSA